MFEYLFFYFFHYFLTFSLTTKVNSAKCEKKLNIHGYSYLDKNTKVSITLMPISNSQIVYTASILASMEPTIDHTAS